MDKCRVTSWRKNYQGWIGAFVLAVGACAMGVLLSTMVEGTRCSKRITALTQGYVTLIGQKDSVIVQKDLVISKLSLSAAKASDAAVNASNAAIKASSDESNKQP